MKRKRTVAYKDATTGVKITVEVNSTSKLARDEVNRLTDSLTSEAMRSISHAPYLRAELSNVTTTP